MSPQRLYLRYRVRRSGSRAQVTSTKGHALPAQQAPPFVNLTCSHEELPASNGGFVCQYCGVYYLF